VAVLLPHLADVVVERVEEASGVSRRAAWSA
jgi:hypothetical protein